MKKLSELISEYSLSMDTAELRAWAADLVELLPEMCACVERYAHLRAGNRADHLRAPYVMNPVRSRLFAIKDVRESELDSAVDCDILDTKVNELRIGGELTKMGYTGPPWPSQEFTDALCELARQRLGWSIDRYKASFRPEDELNIIDPSPKFEQVK